MSEKWYCVICTRSATRLSSDLKLLTALLVHPGDETSYTGYKVLILVHGALAASSTFLGSSILVSRGATVPELAAFVPKGSQLTLSVDWSGCRLSSGRRCTV